MESSFQIAVCECPDITACTLAVDVTGRYAVISGRKSLALIDLDGNDQVASEALKESSNNANVTGSSSTLSQANSASKSAETQVVLSTPRCAPIVRKMVRNSKYEPTASQFNRHMNDLFALTTYQNVEIFSIEDLNPMKPKLILKGHSRAIADVQWSNYDPYLLGSSAADCLTNLWDIRDSRRPTASLTSVSGATLVKFSKTSPNLLATSHEIDVRIWDIRQPNLPLYYIAAHLQKINGMDWSPNKTSYDHEQLITCSQDNTIKLWDLNANKIKPSASLPTRAPAWRIMYTPISQNAILTSTLPQLKSRTECMALKLWSMKPDRYAQKKLELILGLVGHTDVIVDFDWRTRDSTTSNSCEIISWSKDQTLRVWTVDNQFIEMNVDNSDFENECIMTDAACDSLGPGSLVLNDTSNQSGDTSKTTSQPSPLKQQNQLQQKPLDTPSEQNSSLLDSPNKLLLGSKIVQQVGDGGHDIIKEKTRDERESDSDPDDLYPESKSSTNELKQEFNLLNKNIPNIDFEELNSLRRVCVVTARAKTITCRLRIALPPTYPQVDCPTFTILESNHYGGESLSKEMIDKLLNLLNETAKSQLSRSRNCIEPCLRKFIAALQKITSHSSHRKQRASGAGTEYKDDPITLSAQRDHSVPFPKTSGARFCGNLLVCFGRPMIPTVNMSASDSANWLVETPRSMAQLSAQLDNMRRQGSYNLSHISISYFYYGAMRRADLQARGGGSAGGGGSGSGSKSSQLSSSRLAGGSGAGGSKYLAGRGSRSSSSHAQSIISKNFKCGPVLVYDVSSLLGGLSRELAESYVFDKDVIKMCRKNAEIAAAYNRRDLVQIWSLAELSSEGVLNSYIPNKEDNHALSLVNYDSDFGDRPWTMHPFGSKLIQSLIDHYVYNCHDVQTAAMLVWTFSSPKLARSMVHNNMQNSYSDLVDDNNTNGGYSSSTGALQLTTTTVVPSGNNGNGSGSQNSGNGARKSNNHNPLYNMIVNYHTVIPGMLNKSNQAKNHNQISQVDTISGEWSFVNGPETHLYSNSWSNSTIHEHLAASSSQESALTSAQHQQQHQTHVLRNKLSGSDLSSSAAAAPPTGVDETDGSSRTQGNKCRDMINTSAHTDTNTKNHSSTPPYGTSNSTNELFQRLNILSPERGLQNDLIMHIYSELLYRLNLLNQRAMVLKNIGSNSCYSEIFGDKHDTQNESPKERLPNLSIQCHNSECRNKCHSVQCQACKRYSLYCSICRLPVRGSCSICLKCSHGGHVNHFKSWFSSYDFCPAGCGCRCLSADQPPVEMGQLDEEQQQQQQQLPAATSQLPLQPPVASAMSTSLRSTSSSSQSQANKLATSTNA